MGIKIILLIIFFAVMAAVGIYSDREADLVYMTGPAEVVFDGEIQI